MIERHLFRRYWGVLMALFLMGQTCIWAEETVSNNPQSDLVVEDQEEVVEQEQPAGADTGVVGEASVVNLDEARLAKENGEWLEAQRLYKAYLTQEGLDQVVRNEAQRELEEINMRILFSPLETEDSTFYTVEKGDNLYNIAKKYGTTIELIKKSNQLTGDLIKPGMKLKVVKSKFSVTVNKSNNTLELYEGDTLLKTYPVATGANNSTPAGSFTIVNKLENPTWYKAGAVVEPGSPDNILGTRWLGFSTKGYGIHGTTEPESIGKSVSAGCIRMWNQDVEELYGILPLGTTALVKD